MLRSLCFIALAAAGFALAYCAARTLDAQASSVVRLDLQGLVDEAELGLEARVLETSVELDSLGRPCTRVVLDASRDFLGGAGGRIEFCIPGGIASNGRGLILPGMPTLSAGEEVLLFLSEESSAGLRVPVGLAQGKFRIVRDATGARTFQREDADLELFDRESSTLSHANNAAVFDYAAAVAEIQAAVAHRRAHPRGSK